MNFVEIFWIARASWAVFLLLQTLFALVTRVVKQEEKKAKKRKCVYKFDFRLTCSNEDDHEKTD